MSHSASVTTRFLVVQPRQRGTGLHLSEGTWGGGCLYSSQVIWGVIGGGLGREDQEKIRGLEGGWAGAASGGSWCPLG